MQPEEGTRLDERGETLVELVVALAILGIAAVAIMAGLMLSVRTSDEHRKLSTSGAYVRSWAEAIQTSVDDANKVKTCAEYYAVFDVLKTENPDLITLTPSCTATTPSMGVQKLVLKVQSTISSLNTVTESLVVFLRAPCSAAGATPCA
jgi:prepilin-type N-terminal cleavage/methylation domain-containing protein